MKLTYPYEVDITTKKEAVDYLRNQCRNCPKYCANWDCSGATVIKCQRSAKLVAAEFGGKWVYETGKEDCDITNGHSSYYDVFRTTDEAKAIETARTKGNDYLIRKATIDGETIEQTYSVTEGWF